jgi:nucleotide-binding universal stress UspA family protein
VFKKIVVGTDGSRNAEEAIRVAAELAAVASATLHVVAAYRPLAESELRAIARELPDEFRDLVYRERGADIQLASARRIVEIAGIDAEFVDVVGDAAEVLLDAVDETGADLLVVGSRGEGRAGRLLHGSVSTKVLHHAPCTTLVVKDGEQDG